MKFQRVFRKFEEKGISFKTLIAVPFCIALLIEVLLCAGVVYGSGSIARMESDSYDLFSERAHNRAEYLQGDMVNRWSDIDGSATEIETKINTVLAAEGKTASDLTAGSETSNKILEAAMENLLASSQQEVDGSFLVLTGGSQTSAERSALYVRDSNPEVTMNNNSDLLLGVAPLSIGKHLDIALDSDWSTLLTLKEDEEQDAFYLKPIEAAQDHPDALLGDLGYWSQPINFSSNKERSITYSVPLRDSAGHICGVFGVEVKLSRILSLLPYRDLSSDGEGSYVLATTDKDGASLSDAASSSNTYKVVGTSGASARLYMKDDQLTTSLDGRGYHIARPVDQTTSNQAITSSTELKIYDTTSPFVGEHWVLMGVEQEPSLFAGSIVLHDRLFVAFGLSIVIGLIIALITVRFASSRIAALMVQVRSARTDELLHLKPTGVEEVDELADVIKAYSSDVVNSAARLSRILALSGRGIAAFEYYSKTRTLSYTKGFFELMGAEDMPGMPRSIDWQALRDDELSIEDSKRMWDVYRPYFEFDEEAGDDRVAIIKLPHKHRWLRVVFVEDVQDKITTGLVEDVTREIEVRRQIEHDRDYDILTGLLNRRGFEREVGALLADPQCGYGAMIMLDLDNLKQINDTNGHDWGDLYIKTAAEAVRDMTREGEFSSRVSGDEFLVFLTASSTEADVAARVEALRASLLDRPLLLPDDKQVQVRSSIGIAFYPGDASDYDTLRRFADFAMYEAKRNDKGTVCRFSAQSFEEVRSDWDDQEQLPFAD